MINVIFEAPIEQYDGWGIGANKYLDALAILHEQEKINLCVVPLRLSKQIKTLKSDYKYLNFIYRFSRIPGIFVDVVIQNTLPHLMKYSSQCKEIGLFYSETCPINEIWIKSLKDNTDLVIAATKLEKETLVNQGINAVNINMPFKEPPFTGTEKNSEFTFYFIGEACTRKNIPALLFGYFSAFSKKDNVNLIIKTNRPIDDIIKYVKACVRKTEEEYPKYQVIFKYIENIESIHESSHCFVMPSYGESTCIPLIDALTYGNSAIITAGTGMDNFASKDYDQVYLVSSNSIPCECSNPPIPFIYKYPEMWRKIDLIKLINTMRNVYNNKYTSNNTKNSCLKEHDVNKIAEKLYEAIRS